MGHYITKPKQGSLMGKLDQITIYIILFDHPLKWGPCSMPPVFQGLLFKKRFLLKLLQISETPALSSVAHSFGTKSRPPSAETSTATTNSRETADAPQADR